MEFLAFLYLGVFAPSNSYFYRKKSLGAPETTIFKPLWSQTNYSESTTGPNVTFLFLWLEMYR